MMIMGRPIMAGADRIPMGTAMVYKVRRKRRGRKGGGVVVVVVGSWLYCTCFAARLLVPDAPLRQ